MSKEIFSSRFYNDSRLVSLWRMEGNANDSKGSNNGTTTDISFSNSYGRFGQGALFNGTTSQITYPNTPVSGNVNFTMSVWAYFTADTDYSACLYMGGASVNSSLGFYRDNGASGTIKASCYGGGGAVDSGVVGTLNTWFHIVLVGNASDDKLRIYINGKYAGIGSANAWSISGTGANVIGKYATGGENWTMNGYLDDCAIFNDMLSDNEIYELYHDLSFKFRPGSIGSLL